MRLLYLILLILILVPVPVFAGYTVYLKNGSTVENVIDYVDDGVNVTIYLKAGSMVLDKGSILKIEGYSEETKGDIKDTGEAKEGVKEEVRKSEVTEIVNDSKTEELEKLRSEVDLLNSEIRATEEKEMELVTQINEKMGRRYTYNVYQLRRLEAEIEPLRQELYSVQNRKKELLQKRNTIENILKEQR